MVKASQTLNPVFFSYAISSISKCSLLIPAMKNKQAFAYSSE